LPSLEIFIAYGSVFFFTWPLKPTCQQSTKVIAQVKNQEASDRNEVGSAPSGILEIKFVVNFGGRMTEHTQYNFTIQIRFNCRACHEIRLTK